jgi:cytochrome c-type biogenesis protein CcmH
MPRSALAFWPTLLACLLLAVPALAPVAAQVAQDATPLEFRDRAEEHRFHELVSELRCVMCQNQSLADSDAPIAHDLRREVFDLMREGRNDAEIKTYLVQRYGEFVLYRPQLGRSTWLLWFGPGVVVLLGAVAIIYIVRKRSATTGRIPEDNGQEW